MTQPKTCRYCNGYGGFTNSLAGEGWVPCPDCDGTGELKAVITIDWKPNS
ncbi:MAG: hypothetical protein K2G49_00435 [Muribaculum sp.]|nr:hypothetical protein [Muribaculum sp.]